MPESLRFVALDVHNHYLMIGAVDAQQTVVLSPRRVTLAQFPIWATAHFLPTDQVVLETTTNAWDLYDFLIPFGARVVVADPVQVTVIAAAVVKTDKRDTLALARLLAANLVPAVWVPPPVVRELRALVAHRQRLIKQRTMAKNRLQSLLHRHNLRPPPGELAGTNQRTWWRSLDLSPAERLRAAHDLALVDALAPLIGAVEAELAHLSQQEPWQAQMPFLLQLPGIGLIAAMTLLAAIGDMTRFATAKHYAGLGTRVHASGQQHRSGSITKRGRTDLRTILIESAWTAVRSASWWRARYTQLTTRMPPAKAIVAIARKLLVVLWHVLWARVADHHAEVEAVARRLWRWGTRHAVATQAGLSRQAFVLRHLIRLGLALAGDPKGNDGSG
jgi:transposase